MDETLRQLMEKCKDSGRQVDELMEKTLQAVAEYKANNAAVVKKMTELLDEGHSQAKKTLLEILNNAPYTIGYNVLRRGDFSQEEANEVRTICRRRFNAQEIVLIVLWVKEGDINRSSFTGQGRYTRQECFENRGMVFTDNAIYLWKKYDDEIQVIPYKDIVDVEYESDSVTIKRTDGEICIDELYTEDTDALEKAKEVKENDSESAVARALAHMTLGLGAKRSSSKDMYNFLMDIVDAVSEQ